MLYDKRWDKKLKTDPHTVEAFIAWLEKKPAGEKYNWVCINGCVVAQYRRFVHKQFPWPVLDDMLGSDAAHRLIGSPKPWTFGAALKRARALSQ